MKKVLWLATLLGLAIAFAGCSNSDDNGVIDTGTGETEPCVPTPNWIGDECTGDSYCRQAACSNDALCFTIGPLGQGFCTKLCGDATDEGMAGPDSETDTDTDTLEDIRGCGQPGVACTPVPFFGPGGSICSETCIPEPGFPSCELPWLACAPHLAWSHEAQSATCTYAACLDDADCVFPEAPATDGRTCGDNTDCRPGGECVLSTCEYLKTCDHGSGRCIFYNPDTDLGANVEIGDPCKSDFDCGDGMECLEEIRFNDAPTVDFPNGFCTKKGCSVTKDGHYAATTAFKEDDYYSGTEYDCGDEGVCYGSIFNGGFCLRKCAQNKTVGTTACRQTVWGDQPHLDHPGEYECVDYPDYYTNDYIKNAGHSSEDEGEMPLAETAFCVTSGLLFESECERTYSYNNDFKCYVSLSAGNSGVEDDMVCRDPLTGDKMPNNQSGRCLDSSTSGPDGNWTRYNAVKANIKLPSAAADEIPTLLTIDFWLTTPLDPVMDTDTDDTDVPAQPIPDAVAYFIESTINTEALPIKVIPGQGRQLTARVVTPDASALSPQLDSDSSPLAYYVVITLYMEGGGGDLLIPVPDVDYRFVSTQTISGLGGATEIDLNTDLGDTNGDIILQPFTP